MSNYHDVVQFQKRGDKWTAQRLGSAKLNDKGEWDVWLNALPLTIDGQCRISIVSPREERDDPPASAPRTRPAKTGGAMPEDEVPF